MAVTTSTAPLSGDTAGSNRLGPTLALFALLLAPLGLLADKAVVPLVIATAVTGGIVLGRRGLPWHIIERPLAAMLGLFILWCLIASLWSFEPIEGLKLALRIGFLVFVLLYLVGLAGLLDKRQRSRVARALICGFAAAVVLITIELAFGGQIFNLLEGPTRTAYAADSRLNRGVSAVAILAWPLALLAWQQRRQAVALLLLPAIFIVTLFSESSATSVALALALPAAAAALIGRGVTRLILALAVGGALLAAPLIIETLQRAELSQSHHIPETGLYRLHIWGVITERIAERPFFGWGFDASPKLPTGDTPPFRPGEKIIPSHPHNAGLQIMVELGLVGSLLAVALLFVVGRRIDNLDRIPRACAVGMTVTVIGIACTAYGIWQSHWLSVIGAAAALFVALQTPDARGN